MSDNLDVKTTQEGVIIPGESEIQSLNPEIHKQAVEKKARVDGWKPLAEFQGEPADWVDAPEFIGRQKLYDRIHNLSRQNTRLEKDIQTITKHFATMEETAYKRALEELKDKQARAVEEQDTSVVQKTTEEIVKLEQQRQAQRQQTQVQQTVQTNEAFNKWREENKWFDSNTEMREDAISIGIGHAAAHPEKTQEQVLVYVTEKIKKMYHPTQESQKKIIARKEATVEGSNGLGGEPGSGGKKGKLTVQDLDETEVSVMKTFLRRGVFKDAAKKANVSEQEYYLADLAKRKGAK